MQPTPVLSLGSDLQSPSLSSQPPLSPAGKQTSISGWWVLVSTDPLCRNLSALPSASLLLCSPPWLQPLPISTSKGLPSVWKLFLLHSSLPDVQVPSLFFCLCFFFFLLPFPGMWGFLAFWEVWGLLPAFSRCFVQVVPHVFLMYLWGGRWSPCLTPLPSWRSPLCFVFLYAWLPFTVCWSLLLNKYL